MENVGFIGVGNMGYAILSNYAKKKFEDVKLYAYDPFTDRKETLEESGVTFTENNIELVKKCGFTAILVKPQQLPVLLEEISPYLTKDKVIISFAAGADESFYKKYLGSDRKIVFIMPNINISMGLGASAASRTNAVNDEEFFFSKKIVGCGGIVKEIPPDKMREVIALNASAPAFIFYFAEQFAKYAEANGIGYTTGLELFSQSMKGSAEMLLKSGVEPEFLIKQVCSAGGTTIAGMEKLYAIGNAIKETCEACTKRAYELSKDKTYL
jgi:pyrroline-5-carboxylate reductase